MVDKSNLNDIYIAYNYKFRNHGDRSLEVVAVLVELFNNNGQSIYQNKHSYFFTCKTR